MVVDVSLAAYPPREASAEGGSMRGAFGAWAATETVGGYNINGDTAKIVV